MDKKRLKELLENVRKDSQNEPSTFNFFDIFELITRLANDYLGKNSVEILERPKSIQPDEVL
jgi:hypothetical protein